jgi:FkbM family methyltransferase
MNTQQIRPVVSSLLHRYPLSIGCGRIANTSPIKWLDPTDTQMIVEARLPTGQTLNVPIRDFVGRAVYYFGDLDKKISSILKAYLKPGDTFIDIGAQFGLYTVQAASLVGSEGTVHAFEPQPRSARLLKSSLEGNGLTNTTIHQLALGLVDGRLPLTIPSTNAGAGSLVQSQNGVRINVQVKNASGAFDKSGIQTARLIKIDVEGFENAVICGALDWIETAKPDALIIETTTRASLEDRGFPVALADLGYTILSISRWPFGLRLRATDMSEALRAHDILAVRDTRAVASFLV